LNPSVLFNYVASFKRHIMLKCAVVLLCALAPIALASKDTLIRHGDLVIISLWRIADPNAQIKNVLSKGSLLSSTAVLKTATVFQIESASKNAPTLLNTYKSDVKLYRYTNSTSKPIQCYMSPRLICSTLNGTTAAKRPPANAFIFRVLDKHTSKSHPLKHGDYIKFRSKATQVDCNTEPKTKYINCGTKSNDPYSYGFVILKYALLV